MKTDEEIVKKINPALSNGIKLITFDNAEVVAQLFISNIDVAAAALCNELDHQLKLLIKDN